jgi:NADH-quinone oxidoreductase subunit N
MQHLIQNNLQSTGAFIPELVLMFGAVGLFLTDLLWRKHPARVTRLTLAALLVLVVAAMFLVAQPEEPVRIFNGLLANDPFGQFFKWLALAAGILTVVIAAQGDAFPPERIGQFYALLVAIVLGMFLMASATDLLMIYLAIELVSLLSYVLAGYRRGDRKASEAALKYVIFGGVASGVMLFGMSYLYGLLGTTDVLEFGRRMAAFSSDMGSTTAGSPEIARKLALVVALVFVLAGFGYKIASVPWHMWCPDVYEGAPTPFTAFLSVGPKAAGFAVMIRFFYAGLAGPEVAGLAGAVAGIPWPAVIGVISAITMTLGNLAALSQTNLKRLLAYSSIAHAGYALMGLAAVSARGTQSILIYLLIYLVMNLGAFLVVILVAQATGSESIRDYRGLSRRHPFAAIAFAIFLFSLTGIPPFAGFIGKWYLFAAVLERGTSAGGSWYLVLAIIAAINTAISLYYYLRIARAMFFEEPYSTEPLRSPLGYDLLLGAFSAAIVVFGLWSAPLTDWAQQMSIGLIHG